MKIVFGSDIHGSSSMGEKLVCAAKKEGASSLILCGDIYYHGPRNPLPGGHSPMKLAEILNANKEFIRCVRGNCDSEVDATISEFPFEEQLFFDFLGKKIFVTHGHRYDKQNPPPIDFDIMIYGHYHVGLIEKTGEKIFACAGSVSLPKNNSLPSYLLLDKNNLTLKTLEGTPILVMPLKD